MEIRVLAATGVLGAGFKVESLNRGIALKPTFIACDAGSTDSGPAYLGSGKPKLSQEACARDLRLLLKARDALGVMTSRSSITTTRWPSKPRCPGPSFRASWTMGTATADSNMSRCFRSR